MSGEKIHVPVEALSEFCRKHRVRLLAFFGSVLREDFAPTSDVDVLVEFGPGEGPSLLDFAGIQIELGELLGREVHLHTPTMLPPRWRERVRRDAWVQYAA